MPKFRIRDKVMLRPGSKSYKHFINYMPVEGMIIAVDDDHYQGQSHRPYLVRFVDDRTSWYGYGELIGRSGIMTSDGYPK